MLQATKKQLLIAMIYDLISGRDDDGIADKAIKADKSIKTDAIKRLGNYEFKIKDELIAKATKGYGKEGQAENDVWNLIFQTMDTTIEAVVDIYLMLKSD